MPAALQLLVRHVFTLARYDENYDVRDRARMLTSLLIGISPSMPRSGEIDDNETEDAATRGGVILRREQVKLVLFEGKTSSSIRKPSYSASPVLILFSHLLTFLLRQLYSVRYSIHRHRQICWLGLMAHIARLAGAGHRANSERLARGIPVPARDFFHKL